MMAARGLRNNNPGNIRLSRTLWQGEIRPSQDRSFCQFRTMAYGYRALEMQVPNTYVPDVDDRAAMCAFAAAISQVENGVPAVMADVAAGWELL